MGGEGRGKEEAPRDVKKQEKKVGREQEEQGSATAG